MTAQCIANSGNLSKLFNGLFYLIADEGALLRKAFYQFCIKFNSKSNL